MDKVVQDMGRNEGRHLPVNVEYSGGGVNENYPLSYIDFTTMIYIY